MRQPWSLLGFVPLGLCLGAALLRPRGGPAEPPWTARPLLLAGNGLIVGFWYGFGDVRRMLDRPGRGLA